MEAAGQVHLAVVGAVTQAAVRTRLPEASVIRSHSAWALRRGGQRAGAGREGEFISPAIPATLTLTLLGASEP